MGDTAWNNSANDGDIQNNSNFSPSAADRVRDSIFFHYTSGSTPAAPTQDTLDTVHIMRGKLVFNDYSSFDGSIFERCIAQQGFTTQATGGHSASTLSKLYLHSVTGGDMDGAGIADLRIGMIGPDSEDARIVKGAGDWLIGKSYGYLGLMNEDADATHGIVYGINTSTPIDTYPGSVLDASESGGPDLCLVMLGPDSSGTIRLGNGRVLSAMGGAISQNALIEYIDSGETLLRDFIMYGPNPYLSCPVQAAANDPFPITLPKNIIGTPATPLQFSVQVGTKPMTIDSIDDNMDGTITINGTVPSSAGTGQSEVSVSNSTYSITIKGVTNLV